VSETTSTTWVAKLLEVMDSRMEVESFIGKNAFALLEEEEELEEEESDRSMIKIYYR